MSRRRGRAHHHERPRQPSSQPGQPAEPRAVQAAEPPVEPDKVTPPAMIPDASRPDQVAAAPAAPTAAVERSGTPRLDPAPGPRAAAAPAPAPARDGVAPARGGMVPPARGGMVPPAGPAMNGGDRGTACTAPQLRRFIKSRPFVPMHELRRRFAIDAEADDVSAIDLNPGRIFVGLPAREGALLGELVRAGEVGYELSLDPRTPVVVGVYPMRPVPRP